MSGYKIIDLFAGIGGFRLGFQNAGYESVFSSEIDDHACEMYELNFNENPKCDITKLDPIKIPDFDVLCAGFPCQAFSISGKMKGFYDDTRGTLFFDICRILEVKKPPVFVLENVFNLEKHDSGKTLTIMISSLEKLGYTVNYKVLNARDFGVPQNRERIIIVGNRLSVIFNFDLLKKKTINSMTRYLDDARDGSFEYLPKTDYTLLDESLIKRQPKSGLMFCGYRNKKIRKNGVRPGTIHLSRVHKQPNRIYDSRGLHPTMSSQEASGRYFIRVGDKVRKLTMNECYRFMGFPENFKKTGASSQLYARIGNSVCVNMVEAIAKEIKSQIFKNGGQKMNDIELYLEKIYDEAEALKDVSQLKLSLEQFANVKKIADKEETFKGVFTVLFTSLVYKNLFPNQDVRYHQANMSGGYSGRSFDTKYITPFMKRKRFLGAMKESGWLTRSLEQNIPYDLNYPGKIQNVKLKKAFLEILNDIEVEKTDPEQYILALLSYSIKLKKQKSVTLINPIDKETKFPISEIMQAVEKHFYFGYRSRGASILPVIAIYSVYQCIVNELKRYEGLYLDELASHNSCDRSSGATGDIVLRKKDDDSIYEVIEVKFDIPIDVIMIDDVYQKIADKPIQRYFILSTKDPSLESMVEINEKIIKVREEHGCQIIVNGVLPTIKYYLRLIENTDVFITNYISNIEKNSEINYEHRIAWNKIFEDLSKTLE